MAATNGASAEVRREALTALASALVDRHVFAAALGEMYQGDRRVYEALGWRKRITYHDYLEKYERQDIAGRIVDMPANATWREGFDVTDDPEDPDRETPFEVAWKDLDRRHRITAHFARLDRIAGIGTHGALYIGVSGQQPEDALRRGGRLLYLSVFSEPNATIDQVVSDPINERYGLPEIYSLASEDLTAGGAHTARRTASRSVRAHWSRVIHAAELAGDSRIYGRPRLQRVYNVLDALMIVYGGAAEAFWRGARPRYHVDIDADFAGHITAEMRTEMAEEVEALVHGLKDFIRTYGSRLAQLQPAHGEPDRIAAVLLDLLAAATGIPKRILMGSERGELASNQDAMEWAHRVAERQTSHAEPVIVRPFVDRLIGVGLLPEPAGGTYEVLWPDITSPSAEQRAEQADRIAAAEAKHAQAVLSGGALLTTNEMREQLGLSPIAELEAEVPGGQRQLPPPADDDGQADDELTEDEVAGLAALEAPMVNRLDLPMLTRLVNAVSEPTLRNSLVQRVRGAMMDFLRRASSAFGLTEPDPTTRAAIDFMREFGAERVAGINDTTREALARSLAEGMRNDETTRQLAARIRRVFRDASRSRAILIAQTESTRAGGFGTLEGLRQAGVQTKTWWSQADGRVRDSHTLLHGVTVSIGEPFISRVTGEAAQFPGDFPSAAESAGCRCLLGGPPAGPDGLSAMQFPDAPKRLRIHERRVVAGVRQAFREQQAAVLAAFQD